MSYTNYHINHLFSDSILKVCATGLSIAATLLKPFKVVKWRTGFVSKLNKRLFKINLIAEGYKNVSKDLSIEEALEEYQFSKEALSKYRSFYAKLEKADFFNNPETLELSDKILSNFYTIESQLRRKAFSTKEQMADETNLTSFASQVSLSSLQD